MIPKSQNVRYSYPRVQEGGDGMTIRARENFSLTRAKAGYSIAGLAKAMRVNPSVAFMVEKGHNVRPATAKKACDALRLDFEDLFIIEN